MSQIKKKTWKRDSKLCTILIQATHESQSMLDQSLNGLKNSSGCQAWLQAKQLSRWRCPILPAYASCSDYVRGFVSILTIYNYQAPKVVSSKFLAAPQRNFEGTASQARLSQTLRLVPIESHFCNPYTGQTFTSKPLVWTQFSRTLSKKHLNLLRKHLRCRNKEISLPA